MIWWVLAIVSGLGLAGRNILFKLSNDRLDAAYAALVLSLSMTAVAGFYYVYRRYMADLPILPHDQSLSGAVFAAGAGISLAVANIFLAYAYRSGGNASLTALLQNGAALALTVLLGVFLLNEVIRPMQVLGILAVIIGTALIIKG